MLVPVVSLSVSLWVETWPDPDDACVRGRQQDARPSSPPPRQTTGHGEKARHAPDEPCAHADSTCGTRPMTFRPMRLPRANAHACARPQRRSAKAERSRQRGTRGVRVERLQRATTVLCAPADVACRVVPGRCRRSARRKPEASSCTAIGSSTGLTPRISCKARLNEDEPILDTYLQDLRALSAASACWAAAR
jgi:hypothetical protein